MPVYCIVYAYKFLFTMNHRFPIQFKSADDGSYAINLFFPDVLWCQNGLVNLETYAGALSCMLRHVRLKLLFWALYQGRKLVDRKTWYISKYILTTSFTLNSPMSVLFSIPAQNIISPPPCCRLMRFGASAFGKI